MAYPVGLPTKMVSFGSAVVMESGTPLDMTVTIKASRNLVHRPTGTPLVTAQTVFVSSGGSGTLELPVCDSPDMGLGNGVAIVVGAGQVTHTYTATIRYLNGTTAVGTVTVGPFALLTSMASPVDLDDVLTTSAVPGEAIPTFLVEAQAALAEAQDILDLLGPGGGTGGGGSLSDLPIYTSLSAVQADILNGTLVDGDFILLET